MHPLAASIQGRGCSVPVLLPGHPASGNAGSVFGANQREPLVAPGKKSTCKGSNFGDSLLSKFERHPGASRFIRSSAVKDDFAVAWNLLMALFKFLWLDTQRAGNRSRIGYVVQWVPQVDDRHLFATAYFRIQIVR